VSLGTIGVLLLFKLSIEDLSLEDTKLDLASASEGSRVLLDSLSLGSLDNPLLELSLISIGLGGGYRSSY
jgi:hypothetical protein